MVIKLEFAVGQTFDLPEGFSPEIATYTVTSPKTTSGRKVELIFAPTRLNNGVKNIVPLLEKATSFVEEEDSEMTESKEEAPQEDVEMKEPEEEGKKEEPKAADIPAPVAPKSSSAPINLTVKQTECYKPEADMTVAKRREMMHAEQKMQEFDSSVSQRLEAINKLESLSYDAKKVEESDNISYFKRNEGAQVIAAAKENIEWLYNEEA
jgi:hypothetical protein